MALVFIIPEMTTFYGKYPKLAIPVLSEMLITILEMESLCWWMLAG